MQICTTWKVVYGGLKWNPMANCQFLWTSSKCNVPKTFLSFMTPFWSQESKYARGLCQPSWYCPLRQKWRENIWNMIHAKRAGLVNRKKGLTRTWLIMDPTFSKSKIVREHGAWYSKDADLLAHYHLGDNIGMLVLLNFHWSLVQLMPHPLCKCIEWRLWSKGQPQTTTLSQAMRYTISNAKYHPANRLCLP